MRHVQRFFFEVAQLVVILARWPLAILADITVHPYEVWPSHEVAPLIILYGFLAALCNRLGGLHSMFAALVLYSVVGKKCIAATLYFAGALHATGLVVGTAAALRSRYCQCTRPAHLS